MSTSIVMVFDSKMNTFPFGGEPVDVDSWPSVVATKLFVDNVIAITERGFKGVRPRFAEMPGYGILFCPAIDIGSPEGRIVPALARLAAAGKQPTTKVVIDLLEQGYRDQNLPLPVRPASFQKTKPHA